MHYNYLLTPYMNHTMGFSTYLPIFFKYFFFFNLFSRIKDTKTSFYPVLSLLRDILRKITPRDTLRPTNSLPAMMIALIELRKTDQKFALESCHQQHWNENPVFQVAGNFAGLISLPWLVSYDPKGAHSYTKITRKILIPTLIGIILFSSIYLLLINIWVTFY